MKIEHILVLFIIFNGFLALSSSYENDILRTKNNQNMNLLMNLSQECNTLMIHNYNLTNNNQILTYDLDKSNENIKNVEGKYTKLKLRKKIEIHTPTISEIIKLLKEDKTDELEYKDGFDCTEFTNTLINHFYKNGIVACFTELEYKDGISGHAIVAVNTNKRIVYIEPQSDRMFYKFDSHYDGNTIKSISSCYGFEKIY